LFSAVPAAKVLKARILLKADAAEAGEGWSDGRTAKALDTLLSTVFRTRRRLVEEGFEAVLTRKHSPNLARRRIFDGAAEAKLIALAGSPPPKGRAKQEARQGRLAIHHGGRPGQTEEAVSINMNDSGHWIIELCR